MQVGWSEEENQNLKEFFHLFGGWLVGWYGTRAPRENETDRHPPSPFLSTSCQSVGRVAIVSSTMKKRDSWTRFGTEITALAAGKEEREEKKFPDFGGAEFAAAFTRFHVVLLGRRADRAPLVVNVAKKGIAASEAARPAEMSDKTSIFFLLPLRRSCGDR